MALGVGTATIALIGLGDPRPLTAEQWQQDVLALASRIEATHHSPFNYVRKEDFDALVARVHDDVPSSEPYEIVVGLNEITAAIGDGHTFVATWEAYHEYPISFAWIESDLRVVETDRTRQRLLGAKLLAVGSRPVDKLLTDLTALVPGNENDWYEQAALARLISQAEPLAAFSAAPSPRRATFVLQVVDGERKEVTLSPSEGGWRRYVLGGDGAALPEPFDAPFGFSIRDGIARVSFRGYDDLERLSDAFWAAVASEEPSALILDLRDNGGGNYVHGREHVVYPLWADERLNREGCLFVLIGPRTFSAGMTNATDLRRETEAILVGEPTGARPNGFQETGWFELPNSGVGASAAQRRYRFGPLEADAVEPDIAAAQTFADLLDGVDTVMSVAEERAERCVANTK